MDSGTLETRDLRLVQAIAEAGGATRAAKHLHLSQSAVSHQLRGLEERLGVELFRREGGRLVITGAGEKLVGLAQQVLLPLLRAELELRRGTFRERPKLRLATQCHTAYHWLPSALKSLMAQHPEVELVLHGEVVGDAQQHLKDGLADLVLCVLPPRKASFQRVPLFKDELVLAVPRGHALSRKKFIEGSDLGEETLIQHPVSPLVREHIQRVLFGEHGRVKHLLRLPVSEAALDLVQAGLGVSIVAGFTLDARIARGELAAVPLTRRGMPRRWIGVFPNRSPLEAPIRTLLATLKRHGLPSVRTRAPR